MINMLPGCKMTVSASGAPEPATLLLTGSALLGSMGVARRRRRARGRPKP